MIGVVAGLALFAFALALPLAWFIRGVSRRMGALDTEAIIGQVKAARRTVPNTGGVAIASLAAPRHRCRRFFSLHRGPG